MDALTVLLDKQAIQEVLMTYCRGVDRLDEELVRSVYHPDAYDNHGYWRGKGWDFAPFVVARLRAANRCTMHSITNVLIDVGGELATAESHVNVTLVRRAESPSMADLMGARYVDRLSKRNGQWKIDERTVVLEWHKVERWSAGDAPIALDAFTWGRRDRSDPVYVMTQHRTLRPKSTSTEEPIP